MSETKEEIRTSVRFLKGQYRGRIEDVSTTEEVVASQPAFIIKDLGILFKFEKVTVPNFLIGEDMTADVVQITKVHVIEGQEFTKTVIARLAGLEERLPRYIDSLNKIQVAHRHSHGHDIDHTQFEHHKNLLRMGD